VKPSVLHELLSGKGEAAEAVLLEATRLGNAPECVDAVNALLRRNRLDSLVTLLGTYGDLELRARKALTDNEEALAPAAQRAARSSDEQVRLNLAGFLRDTTSTRLLPALATLLAGREPAVATAASAATRVRAERLDGSAEARDALEHVVADALDNPRGALSAGRSAEFDLVTAAVEIVANGGRIRSLHELIRRRGGRAAQRLSAPRSASDVAACLAGGAAVKPILADAIRNAAPPATLHFIRLAHLLIDPKLAAAVATLAEGPFWSPTDLSNLLAALKDEDPADDALELADLPDLATWVAAGGQTNDLGSLLRLLDQAAGDDASLRLRIARRAVVAAGRRDAKLPIDYFDHLATSGDERLARFAGRHLARRVRGGTDLNPTQRQQAERLLLARCAASPGVRRACAPELLASFRRVFAQLARVTPVPSLDPTTQPRVRTLADTPARNLRLAAAAMLKLLPDPRRTLERLITIGPLNARLAALDLAASAGSPRRVTLLACRDTEPRMRARAVTMLPTDPSDAATTKTLRRLLDDADPRVRANAVEAADAMGLAREASDIRRLLHARERLGRNRERANAIVALDTSGSPIDRPLFDMLRDRRAAHRLSGVWAVGRTRRWQMLDEVARMSKADTDDHVRRLASSTVRRVASQMRSVQVQRTKPVAAAACLMPSIATVDPSRLEALRGGFGGAEAPAEAGPWLAIAVMLASGGTALFLIARKLRRVLRERADGMRGLDKRLCQSLGLPKASARRLRRLARQVDATSAATLLVCPSLLQRLRPKVTGKDLATVELALMRLA
jgi:hypothetical protein